MAESTIFLPVFVVICNLSSRAWSAAGKEDDTMKKRTLIMLICSVLVLSSAAFGTVAYLTDRAAVTNTFTVGNVGITLDETKTDPSGAPVDADGNPVGEDGTAARTEEGNQYKLVPGQTYTKDPTITVKAGSESAYISMVVQVSKAAQLDAIYDSLQSVLSLPARTDGKFPYLSETFVSHAWGEVYTWSCVSNTRADDTYTLVFNLMEKENTNDGLSLKDAIITAGDTAVVLPALFDSITIPGQSTGEQLAAISDMQITVYGRAIQTTTFDSADQAWAAYDAQYAAPTVTPGDSAETT